MKAKRNVICPFCGRDTLPDARYCVLCGKNLSGQGELKKAETYTDPEATLKICPVCSAGNPAYARYCAVCGSIHGRRAIRPVLPADDAPPAADEREDITAQVRMLEAAYIRQLGAKPGTEAAGEALPPGWAEADAVTRLRALVEAIDEDIRVWETQSWKAAN